jgi:dihydrodipicolinate synthase/N-acetylneuraminate lyase
MSLPDDVAVGPIADVPIALTSQFAVNAEASLQLMRHIRAGGVPTLLVGPSANFPSYGAAQFSAAVDITVAAANDGPVILAIGPELGRMLDQAAIVERSGLRHIMVLPIHHPADTHGTADGIRSIAARLGHGVIVDLVRDNHLRPVTLRKLVNEGAVTAVRYSVVAANPGDDAYLDAVIDIVGRERVISGAGEPAALDHLAVRGLATITSGAAVLAPGNARRTRAAIAAGDLELARTLLAPAIAFERIRLMLGPIQVLHDAVSFAGIAPMGPQMPMISRVKDKYRAEFEAATRALFAAR